MFHVQLYRVRFEIMNLLKKKMLLAPILAVALAFLLGRDG